MKIPTKNCIVCGKEFAKPYTCGRPEWKLRKYCSRVCINIGRIPHNKRSDFDVRCKNCNIEFRKRNYTDKYCSIKCGRAQQVITKESRQKAMATRLAKYGYIVSPKQREKLSEMFSGSKSHFWKGGLTAEAKRLRRTAKYRNWRKAVYERDDYTCQECHNRGGRLHPHHLKPWAKYPKLRFVVSNGQTLCIPCHKQTDSYAGNLR